MHLTRSVPGANIHRYYRMQVLQGLFGTCCVMREWGRIGRAGQIKTDWYSDETEARHAMAVLLRAKRRRGYRLKGA